MTLEQEPGRHTNNLLRNEQLWQRVITGYLRDIRKQCNRNVVSEDVAFLLCVVLGYVSGVALQTAFRL